MHLCSRILYGCLQGRSHRLPREAQSPENGLLRNTFGPQHQLTVTVLASISVKMNSPPSKSAFMYRRALGKEVGNPS